MLITSLLLLLLPQQILLSHTFSCCWSKDIMYPWRQEEHGLELVPKLGSVLRRCNTLCVFALLALNHIFDPRDDTGHVAC
jgi:hypothetical protein